MFDHRRGRRSWAAAAVVSLALAGVTACGSDKAGSASSASPAGGGPSAAATKAAEAGTANTLDVVALDYSYRISGSPQPGLVAMTFDNKGKYAHEMGVSKLKDGVTLDQIKQALAKGEEAAQPLLADPDAELTTPTNLGPNMKETVAAKLAAGHYVVVCFLPGPDGMPHVMMGMIGEFTVAGDESDAQPPATEATVQLTDSGITLPVNFKDGGTFEVKNTGAKVHDFSLARLQKPGTLPDFFQCVAGSFANGAMVDKCPGTLAGGVNSVQPGESAYLTVTLEPGSYGYVSTEGDGADVQAGLAGEFSVG